MEIMTIEVISEALNLRDCPVQCTVDRLDKTTVDLEVKSEDCDTLTDWLDEQKLDWRLV